MLETKRRWVYRRPSATARLRLFCFPYAGGSAAAYGNWQNGLPDWVELCSVQPLDRGLRTSGPGAREVPALVRELAPRLAPYFDLPFAFFGHSLGALLAFELARLLKATGEPKPRALFLSSAAAPHLDRGSISGLPDEEFLARIRAYGGTPDTLLDDPELLEVFLPVLRADFALFEGYRFELGPMPDCPVHLYGGDRDHIVTPSRLAAWGDLLPIASTQMFSGGHFYFQNEHRALLASMGKRLSEVARTNANANAGAGGARSRTLS